MSWRENYTREMNVIRAKFERLFREQRVPATWQRALVNATAPSVPATRAEAVERLAAAIASMRVASAYWFASGTDRRCSPAPWCGSSIFVESVADAEGFHRCIADLERAGTEVRARYLSDCRKTRVARRAGLSGFGQSNIEVTVEDRRDAEWKIGGTARGLLVTAAVVAGFAVPLAIFIRRDSSQISELGAMTKTKGWSKRVPKRVGQRRQLKKTCGSKCFLMPSTMGFPICKKCSKTTCSCAVDCGGAKAAFARARQTRRNTVAKKAVCRARRAACPWAQTTASGKAASVRC